MVRELARIEHYRRPNRLLRRAWALIAFVAACYTVPTSTTPRANSQIRIELPAPLTIAAVGQPGDSLWLRDITSIRGRVLRVTPDTVYLRVNGAGGSSGPIPGIPPGRQAAVPRQPGVVVERDASGAATIVGLLALVAVVALVAGAAALSSSFPDS